MGLSSNVLWHQTSKDGFFKILKSREILYSYSLEKPFPLKDDEGIAFPMISLSDIPICEMPHNKWAYGDYAIGFSRDWGNRNKFAPVWYCERTSNVYKLLFNLMIKTLEDAEKNDEKSEELKKRLGNYLYLFSNVKSVQGPLPKRKYINYRFYDEREYRLVPLKPDLDREGYELVLFEEGYNNYKKDHKKSSCLDFGLDFTLEDVKYLIVKSESNKNEVDKILRKYKETSHIHVFTKAQILEDLIGIEHNVKVGVDNINPLSFDELVKFFGMNH